MKRTEAVITGATSGIGKEIARGLARRGVGLTLVARDPAKAADTVAELRREPRADADIRVVRADLANLGSVRRAADELGRLLDRVDILLDNAGIAARRPATTVDGFDLMIATNHLGPFLLTASLCEMLTAAASARVVVTASEAHRGARPLDPETFERPSDYGAVGAERTYGLSKLLNIVFTAELARRLAATPVTANCFCPGAVASGLVRESRALSRAFELAARGGVARTPEQGARTGLRLALDPEFASVSGRFVSSTPGLRRLPPVRAVRDTALHARVWERSAELVGAPA